MRICDFKKAANLKKTLVFEKNFRIATCDDLFSSFEKQVSITDKNLNKYIGCSTSLLEKI